jgi:hypothetical protein
MRLQYFSILFFLLVFCKENLSQFYGSNFNFAVSYNYTATSKFFLQPNSADPILRTEYESLDGIYNISFELRYRVIDQMIIGLGSEYIKKTHTNRNFILEGDRINIVEGYELIPVELNIYYELPFSTEKFKFFMGGGGGLYFGKHLREFGDIEFVDNGSKIGYGINVAVGMDYLINELISIRGQMRFRDPELILNSRYSAPAVNYGDKKYLIPDSGFSSKVNIDGVTFTIGLAISF